MNLNEECQVMFAALADAAKDLPESQLSTLIFTAGLRAVMEEKEVPVIPSTRRRRSSGQSGRQSNRV